MKKMYLPIYIIFAVFACTFVIGSFFDYQISSVLYHKLDTFALVVSVIGMAPGYGVLAFIGGGLLYIGLKRQLPNLFVKILLFVLAAAALGSSVYFTGLEFFGPNGFYYLGIQEFWGYFIAFPFDVGMLALGYFLTSKSENDKLWVVYLILLAAIALSLVAGVTAIKAIYHRPRFRTVVENNLGIDFYPWWIPCKEYKSYIEEGIIKEEFKSFPSGHAGTASVFMMATLFLPVINPKYKNVSIIAFFSGLAWLLLIAFSRVYLGAHFLSDVSMGALLGIIAFFAAKVIIENAKYFDSGKEKPIVQQVE